MIHPLKLKCWYTNADSLINKLDELKTRISLYYEDIICVPLKTVCLVPSILDLTITNEDNIIDTLTSCDPLGRIAQK